MVLKSIVHSFQPRFHRSRKSVSTLHWLHYATHNGRGYADNRFVRRWHEQCPFFIRIEVTIVFCTLTRSRRRTLYQSLEWHLINVGSPKRCIRHSASGGGSVGCRTCLRLYRSSLSVLRHSSCPDGKVYFTFTSLFKLCTLRAPHRGFRLPKVSFSIQNLTLKITDAEPGHRPPIPAFRLLLPAR